MKKFPALAIVGVLSAATLTANPEYICSGAEPPEIGPRDIVSISDTAGFRYNDQDDETNNRAGQTFKMGTRLQNHLITGVTFYGRSRWGTPNVTINIREQGRTGALIASQAFNRPAELENGYLTFMFDTRPGEGFTWADSAMEQKYKDEASGLVTLPPNVVIGVETSSSGAGWRLNTYSANLIEGQFYKHDWDGQNGWDRQCVLHISARPSTLFFLK